MKHPSGINQAIVDKVAARRGRLHAFESINSTKTALVVIDLDIRTVSRMYDDVATDTSNTLERINVLAETVRGRGGMVVWVVTSTKPSDNFRALLGEKTAQAYEVESASGEAMKVSPELVVQGRDIHIIKQDYSAFFPGKSDLHEQLQKHDIDTVLIAGTVTNVCCESAARDAYELGYKVIMVSDTLRGHSHGLHEAALATIFRNFGDVRPSEEVISLL